MIQQCTQITAPGAIQGQEHHTFTLLFEDGAVAVLHIYRMRSQEQARTVARNLFDCEYETRDGDQSEDRACCYYEWVCMQPGGSAPR